MAVRVEGEELIFFPFPKDRATIQLSYSRTLATATVLFRKNFFSHTFKVLGWPKDLELPEGVRDPGRG